MKSGIGRQLHRAITQDLLISRNSFFRGSIALNLSFRPAEKRAPTEQYRRRRRRKTDDYVKSAFFNIGAEGAKKFHTDRVPRLLKK